MSRKEVSIYGNWDSAGCREMGGNLSRDPAKNLSEIHLLQVPFCQKCLFLKRLRQKRSAKKGALLKKRGNKLITKGQKMAVPKRKGHHFLVYLL